MAEDDLPDDHPSDPPPSSGASHGPRASNDQGSARERFKTRIESVIPEILKRAVEIGVEKARESPDNLKHFVNDMKLPKEVAHYLLQQIDETKNGLFRVVAKEIRDFLEHTNFAGELQKLLTTVQFEVNTTIRFTPNDGRKPDRDKDAKDKGDGDGDPSDDDAPPESGEVSDGSDTSSRHSLPKPEVKTQVHVRRDDRSSGTRDGNGDRKRKNRDA